MRKFYTLPLAGFLTPVSTRDAKDALVFPFELQGAITEANAMGLAVLENGETVEMTSDVMKAIADAKEKSEYFQAKVKAAKELEEKAGNPLAALELLKVKKK